MKKIIAKKEIWNLIIGIILLFFSVYQYCCNNTLIAILDLGFGMLNILVIVFKWGDC